MDDLSQMSDHDILKSLIRGDPRTLKQGYTAENAVLALVEMRSRAGQHTEWLKRTHRLAFAEGFAEGIAEGRAEQGDQRVSG